MMRVCIDDPDWSVSVTMSISGGYNPDVLDDLRRRAAETFKAALAAKVDATGTEVGDETPMPVGDEMVPEFPDDGE